MGRRQHVERYRPQIRSFVCTVCGNKATFPKYLGKTKAGHVKTVYCYVCKARTDHIQGLNEN
jgi:transcription elongation factor Elf1